MSFYSPEAFRVLFFHSFGGNVAIKVGEKGWNNQLNIWYQQNSIYIECMEYISLDKIHFLYIQLFFFLNCVSKINVWFGWILFLALSKSFFFNMKFFRFVFNSSFLRYRFEYIGVALKNGWTSNHDDLKMHQRRVNSDNQMKRY